MHRLIKKFIGLTLIMLSLGVLAHAEAPKCEITTDANTNKDYLTVSGTTTEPAGTRIMVMLVKPETSVSNIVSDGETGAKAEEVLEAVSHTYVEKDADGNYVYNWKYEMHEDCNSGEYIVRTKVYGVGEVEEVKVTFLNRQRIENAYTASSGNTPMADILDTYGKDLDAASGVEFQTYAPNSVYRDFVIAGMDSETFTDSKDMQDAFKEYVGITKVAANIKTTDKGDVKDMIETSYAKIGISELSYQAYSNLGTDSKKEAAIAHMIGLLGDSTTPADIVLKFSAGVTYARGLDDSYTTDSNDDNKGFTPTIPANTPPKMDPVITNDGSFNDIANVPWAKDAIEALVKHGVVNGKGDNKFAPNDLVKREEFVKMIVEAFKLSVDTKDVTFTDVAEDAWYRNYVKIALSSGIVNGVSDTEFGAGQYISRQDMAVMIQRAAIKTNVEILIVDADKQLNDYDSVAEYAQLPVKQLTQAGVINGDENGNFNPAGSATRAHAAVMLYNLLYK